MIRHSAVAAELDHQLYRYATRRKISLVYPFNNGDMIEEGKTSARYLNKYRMRWIKDHAQGVI